MAIDQTLEQKDGKDQKGGRELTWFLERFREATSDHNQARNLARTDYEWYHNFDDSQWTQAEKDTLKQRKQPIVTSNRIKRKVNFLIGLEQRSRTDPKAYPRNPNDEQAANTATDVLDFIETKTRFDNTASESFMDLCIGGIEAAEVVVCGNDYDIEINLIDFEDFIYDPRSKKADFSDAMYLGYSKWFDKEAALELYPDGEEVLSETLESANTGENSGEDKPVGMFADFNRQRVRVVVLYYLHKGEWRMCHFSGGGVLIEGPGFYLDEEGEPECAIKAQSIYVTKNNERYGVVRDMRSPQREINFRRSKALHLMNNTRLWRSREDVFPDTAQTKMEMARADGILTAEGRLGEEWGFVETNAEIAQNFELLQESKAELEVQGPNAGLQGRGVESQSGRAILAQQNAGVTEENNLFDKHNDWKLRIYRAMWARAKQFWTEEKWIRITDDVNGFRFAHVNVLDTPYERLMQLPEEKRAEALAGAGIENMNDPRLHIPTMSIQQDPQTGQMVQVPNMINALAKMDMDIVIEAAPDVITLQHEEFQQLSDLAVAGIPIPPDVLIEASQLRNKDKLLETMRQAQEAQAPIQQAQIEMEMANKQANIEKTQSETQKNKVSALTDLAEANMPRPI